MVTLAMIRCLHPSVSLNNEHNCHEIADEMSVCKKTALVYVREVFGFELSVLYRDYFMVGECVRFLFTSCEGSLNERGAR